MFAVMPTMPLKKQNKANEITEDELKEGEDQIQKITDKFIAEIDKMVEVNPKKL